MSEQPRISVAVVGGGIGGLCFAIGLLQYPQLDVQVYEAAHKFSEIGAGVAFGPNAQRALRLIGPQVDKAFWGEATTNQDEDRKYAWLSYEFGEGSQCGEHIIDVNNETGQQSVHRAKFLDALVKLVPPGIAHFGKRLEEIKTTDEYLEMVFHDGTTARVDCVVGADGIHSSVRKHVIGEGHPELEPTFAGHVGYRGLVPMEKARAVLGQRYAGNVWMFCGHGGSIMTYPIDHGDTLNIIAMNHSVEKWEGPWVQKVPIEKVKEDFAKWGPRPHDIISLLDPETTSAWALWDLPTQPTFVKGRVVVMGDAAHATTPHQGQGAGQAVEDALVLSRVLGAVKKVEDINLAFRAFDAVRRPRSTRVVKTSRDAGELTALRYPGVGDSKELLKEHFGWRMDWIWHRDIAGECEETLGYLARLQHGENI